MHLKPNPTNQYLFAIFLEEEKILDENDNKEVDISFEPQLDLNTDQAPPNNNPLIFLPKYYGAWQEKKISLSL